MSRARTNISWLIAPIVSTARCNDHITPLLRSLHWLRVAERITFRLAVLTYRCLHGSAPQYLTSLLQCVSGIHTRQRLRSASSSDPMVPRTIRSTIGEWSFQSAAASTWKLCLVLSVLLHQCSSSEVDSRQNYSRVHTTNLTESVCITGSLFLIRDLEWSLWIYVTWITSNTI